MQNFQLLPPRARMGAPLRPFGPREVGQLDVEKIIKRFESVEAEKAQWRGLFDDIYRYFMPNKDLFSEHAPGARKTSFVLDSTAIKQTQRLAGRIQSTMVPAFQHWGRLVAGSDVPKDERQRVDELLDEQTDIIFDNLDTSNFAMAVHESFYDLIAGTGTLLAREGSLDQPLEFTSVPLAHIYPEEGPNGTIETVFRKHNPRGGNIKQIWPMADIPAQIQEKIDDQPQERIEVVDGCLHDMFFGDYVYVVLLRETKTIIHALSMPVSDWIVYRWAKNPGETFGRGPAMDMLPSVRTLNAVVELTLQNAHMAISPPILSQEDGLLNPATLVAAPGVVNMVEDISGVGTLEPKHRFDVANLLIDRHQDEIKQGMYSDTMGPPDGPVKTATELLLRNKELVQDIGSSFARLSWEMQFKIIRRTVDILVRRGKMAPIVVDGRSVGVKYEGPLAQAQDNDDAIAFQQYFEAMAGVSPEIAIGSTKIEEVGRFLGEKLGVPAYLLRSPEDILAMQEAAALMMAQGQAQGMGGGGGGGAPSAPPVQPSADSLR